MRNVDVVVADAMAFSYLNGLEQRELLHQIGMATRRIGVTKAVLWQLHKLVEVAKEQNGCVLSCEVGVQRLCGVRNVPVLDLLALFAWVISLELLTIEQAESVVREKWTGRARHGTGAPPDFDETITKTMAKRADLEELVEALPAIAIRI